MTNELLHEPFVKNPLREVSTFTSVTNLEIPKVTFTLDDDDFIADTETAKELKAEGDVVTFGRNKFKVFVPISETILATNRYKLGTNCRSSVRKWFSNKKRRKWHSLQHLNLGEESMSFYKAGIKAVKGTTLYKAIKSAVADLHEGFPCECNY